jgi:adenylate cyclase
MPICYTIASRWLTSVRTRMAMDTLHAAEPSAQAPVWSPSPVIEWLVLEAWRIESIPDLVSALADRLVGHGVPIWRMFVLVPTLHPLYTGNGYRWIRGEAEVYRGFGEHGIQTSPRFAANPLKLVVVDGYSAVRRRLAVDYREGEFPLLDELKAAGATDYMCMPIEFAGGQRSGISFATDDPEGFSGAHLQQFYDMVPVLARLIERETLKTTATNLLDTYVGRDAGERILSGQITRGSGSTIFSAIWYSDLRSFTELTDALPRDDLLQLLNEYFEAMADAVHANQGHVLKLIGDGMLAIFPIDADCPRQFQGCPKDEACARALSAAAAAEAAMVEVNRRRRAQGAAPVDWGLALHLGEVMYGNVGSRDRLDFTVIGPAVNLTQRLEQLCKQIGRRPVMSAEFADICRRPMVSLGRFDVRGLAGLHEVFGLPD